MKNIFLSLLLIIMIFGFMILGWLSNDFYRVWTNERSYDGLYMGGRNYTNAMETASRYDNIGDWVCINVRGMSFDDCKATSTHECAHELWAEICEKNDKMCEEGQELLGKYST